MTQQKKAKNKAAALNKCTIGWSRHAWEDYLHWQEHDRRILNEINRLIDEVCRDPFKGTGKPEPLKGDLSGFWSRRITKEDRLVYIVQEDVIYIMACRHHY